MGANEAMVLRKADDIMRRVPYQVENAQTVAVTYLSEGKEKVFSFQLDREISNMFITDERKGMFALLKKNQQIFQELSKNMIPMEIFIDRLYAAVLKNPDAKKLQVDLTDSKLKLLDVNITTQNKEEFTRDFMKILGDLLTNLELDRMKEVENKLASARYLENKYGIGVVFGSGASLGGAHVKYRVKPGKETKDLVYLLDDNIAKSIEKRISELQDERLRISLFSLLENAVSLKSIPALACISKFLDSIEGEISTKSVVELAMLLKSSFYNPLPTVRTSFGTEADFMLANPYEVPAAAYTYSRETGATTKKYGVSYRPDLEGGKLAIFMGLQDLYVSWDLVTVPEFIKFSESKIDALHSGMLYYGGLGIGFDEKTPFLAIGTYRLDLSVSNSGVGVKDFGLRVPGLYLGILMGIEAISTAATYSSADFWEYAAQATLIGAVNTLNPYDPIDRLLAIADLAIPELAKDRVGMAEFFERKKRVDSFIRLGQYNKALQEIEAMVDSKEKSVTKDPIAKYMIMLLEDRAIEMEIVHFGSSSPSKEIEKRASKALTRLMELNEKAEKNKVTENEWKEYLGLSIYLSSKFLISYDPAKGIYVRVPSGFEPKEYETLSRELLVASDNISFYLQSRVLYSTAYMDDPMLALGLATFRQTISGISPGMFGNYASALAEAKSEKMNSEYLEFCLTKLSSYAGMFGMINQTDPQLWTVLQTLKDGSNKLFRERDMEQKIRNSPVEYFYTTSDPFGFYQTEYWMPLSSIYMWGRQDAEVNSLIRSDKKVLMLAKAEKKIITELREKLAEKIEEHDLSFDLVPTELSFWDFSGEMSSKEIEKEIKKLKGDYGTLGKDYANILEQIKIHSSNIENSKKELDKAVKELDYDPSSQEARKKVDSLLRVLGQEMDTLGSVLFYQISFFNIQVAVAKYRIKNEDDLDALEELQDQAMEDLDTFIGSRQSFNEMANDILRFAALSVAAKKIDSAIISESVPKKKNK